MQILFMGTPDFAKIILEHLITCGENIVAVVTQPDKPVGRKQILTPPPVKDYAASCGISIYQPMRLRGRSFYKLLESIKPDIIIVAAYGKLLPKEVLEYPKYGCINIHASLLPKYRGASPINAAVINGDEITGIAVQYMSEGIDEGDILLNREIPIGEDETAGELHDRLAVLGGIVMIEALSALKTGTACRIPQDDSNASYTHKLTYETSVIDWNDSAVSIKNKIRGLSPIPAATTKYLGKNMKIFSSRLGKLDSVSSVAGEIISTMADCIEVQTGCGTLCLTDIGVEGSKRMAVKDYLKGHKIQPGIILGGG